MSPLQPNRITNLPYRDLAFPTIPQSRHRNPRKSQTKRRLRESGGKNHKRSNRQTLVGSEAKSTNIHSIRESIAGEMVGLVK